ncbi:hypothetical protein ACWX0K_10815 [Nitrobacteraceae bacterium UC4446_H13]
MTQPLPNVDGFRALLDRIVAKQIAQIHVVENEIRTRGTSWAADEIWKLRNDLARARADLARERQRRG